MKDYLENDTFLCGRVIAALSSSITAFGLPLGIGNDIYKDVGVDKVELLFRPIKCNDYRKIGAVVLLWLKDKSREGVYTAISILSSCRYVVSAEPDYYISTHAIPNDTFFDYLWGMRSIVAPRAWDISIGDQSKLVGVIDSGIDYEHPDLIGNLKMALDESELENTYGQGIGDAGDISGHGTHVAGTIAAVGNNHLGVVGVCWRASLVSLKIGDFMLSLSAAIKAIGFANMNRISVLNASWGGSFYSPSLEYAIEQYNGIFVASAGNSSANIDIASVYPASFGCPNIITVAAINHNGELASFSNYGEASVDLAAPGEQILSTDIEGSYSYMDGTSMAAPHVAGAVALLSSFRPNLSIADLKSILLSTVDTDYRLLGRVLTSGKLNVSKMLELARHL